MINITYAIYSLIQYEYKRLWYFPLPIIFIILSFWMDLPARLGVYGKRATLEFISVRPAVADDYRKVGASLDSRESGVIEFFSDIKLVDRNAMYLCLLEKGKILDNDIRVSEVFFCKGKQNNKYIYCSLFSYYSPQEKLPANAVFYIESICYLAPGTRSYDMVIPYKYLIKDTTTHENAIYD